MQIKKALPFFRPTVNSTKMFLLGKGYEISEVIIVYVPIGKISFPLFSNRWVLWES